MNLLKKSVNFVLFSSSGILPVIKFIASLKVMYFDELLFLSSRLFIKLSLLSDFNLIVPTRISPLTDDGFAF